MKKLNKITAISAALLISLLGVTAFAEDNLLINGNCESETLGRTEWRFKDSGGWYFESENETKLVSEKVQEGSHALCFNSATIAQRVQLQRNVTYTLEFYIKADGNCEVNAGFCDGSQDWPASYNVKTEKISAGTEWIKAEIEFECANTQEYLVYFNLWDKINVYIDNVTLKEKSSYISRLITGVDGNGAVSYSADYKGGAFFTTALYDKNGKLTGVIPMSESGTFQNVNDYGTYTVKSYLIGEDAPQSKAKKIIYDEKSALTEKKTIGAVKDLKLSNNELTVPVGKSEPIDAVLTPEFAYNNDVVWESSDCSVASVSANGIVTAAKAGTAVITARSGEFSDKCTVTVTEKPNTSNITLDKQNIELKEIDSVYPLHVLGAENVIWKSDNENIAAVTGGIVTAKGKGKTKVTASTADGKHSAECDVTVTVSDNTITNDTFFKDTDGNNIYSQGGGIYKFGDKYYWYGVKYKEAPVYAENPQDGKAGNAQYEAFTCYSSDDLVNWSYEGYAFDEKCEGWAGRMGVCYNENTKKYVLISQYAPGTLFATSDSPAGPFKTDHIFTDKVPVENGYTGDQTIFQDDDGRAYMICSSGNGRAYQYVVPLRESDFLDFDYDNVKMLFYDEDGSYIDENGEIQKKDKTGIEGNCMFKYNGNYYFTGSDLYGWNSSRVYYLKSDNILGDYNSDVGLPRIMNGSRDSFAHNSQAGFYVTVHGSEQDLVLYCGDRWGDFAGNGIGYNQWVPITIEGDTPYFNDLHQWKLDADRGVWSVGEGNNYIANSEFEADRKSINTPAGWITRDNVGGYANSNLSGRQYAGNFVWQQTAPEDYIAELSQNISDLPNGTYTMTAWVKSSGGQNVCSLYAESGGERYSKSVKVRTDEWTEVVIADSIAVTDGKCTVGLYSDAHANEWVQIDNLRLVKNME